MDRIPGLAYYNAWHLQILGNRNEAAYEVLRRFGERTGSGQACAGRSRPSCTVAGNLKRHYGCWSERRGVAFLTNTSPRAGPWSWPNFPAGAMKRCVSRRRRVTFPRLYCFCSGQRRRRPRGSSTAACAYRESMGWLMPSSRGLYMAIADYGCGKLTEDELVQMVKPSRWALDWAHHTIGVSHLVHGDRRAPRNISEHRSRPITSTPGAPSGAGTSWPV